MDNRKTIYYRYNASNETNQAHEHFSIIEKLPNMIEGFLEYQGIMFPRRMVDEKRHQYIVTDSLYSLSQKGKPYDAPVSGRNSTYLQQVADLHPWDEKLQELEKSSKSSQVGRAPTRIIPISAALTKDIRKELEDLLQEAERGNWTVTFVAMFALTDAFNKAGCIRTLSEWNELAIPELKKLRDHFAKCRQLGHNTWSSGFGSAECWNELRAFDTFMEQAIEILSEHHLHFNPVHRWITYERKKSSDSWHFPKGVKYQTLMGNEAAIQTRAFNLWMLPCQMRDYLQQLVIKDVSVIPQDAIPAELTEAQLKQELEAAKKYKEQFRSSSGQTTQATARSQPIESEWQFIPFKTVERFKALNESIEEEYRTPAGIQYWEECKASNNYDYKSMFTHWGLVPLYKLCKAKDWEIYKYVSSTEGNPGFYVHLPTGCTLNPTELTPAQGLPTEFGTSTLQVPSVAQMLAMPMDTYLAAKSKQYEKFIKTQTPERIDEKLPDPLPIPEVKVNQAFQQATSVAGSTTVEALAPSPMMPIGDPEEIRKQSDAMTAAQMEQATFRGMKLDIWQHTRSIAGRDSHDQAKSTYRSV